MASNVAVVNALRSTGPDGCARAGFPVRTPVQRSLGVHGPIAVSCRQRPHPSEFSAHADSLQRSFHRSARRRLVRRHHPARQGAARVAIAVSAGRTVLPRQRHRPCRRDSGAPSERSRRRAASQSQPLPGARGAVARRRDRGRRCRGAGAVNAGSEDDAGRHRFAAAESRRRIYRADRLDRVSRECRHSGVPGHGRDRRGRRGIVVAARARLACRRARCCWSAPARAGRSTTISRARCRLTTPCSLPA